jgi:hypothetical protein
LLYHSTINHAYAIHPIPRLETWHRCLGHANYNSIIDMVKSGLLQGAPSHIAPTHSTCEFCIPGKQTMTTIPKICGGGNQATQKLEKVWVDLTGPQDVEPCTGNQYIMNIVDDYTSFPWSIPLRTKDEAFFKLVIWQRERETEMSLKVGIYRTNNGELKSDKMVDLLASGDTDHQYVGRIHAFDNNPNIFPKYFSLCIYFSLLL